MSEFELTADRLRSEQESADGAEEADAVESEGVPAVSETREVTPVERALAELDRLAERDLAEHPDAYQRIHADLRDALAAIDDA